MDRLWDSLDGAPLSSDEITIVIDQCLAHMPKETDEADVWTQHHAQAEDAAASIAYALRTHLTGEAQEAAWSARRAYEALDSQVVNELDIDPSDLGAEDQILGHAAIQQELARQHRDLADLSALANSPDEARIAIETLRTRAHREADGLLGA